MKKALVVISLVALMAVSLVGLVGCGGGGVNITENDLATFRGLIHRMDNAEQDIGEIRNDVGAITAPDLSGYAKTTDIPKLDGYVTRAEYEALKVRLEALENGTGGGSNPPATGQVTVEIVDQTPLLIYSSSSTPMQYLFRVRITNGTDEYKYVSYSLILNCITPAAKVLGIDTDTKLTAFGGYGVIYSLIRIPTPNPAEDNTTQLLFTPSAKIPVAKGGTVEIQHLLTIRTDATEQWEGSLTAVVVSSTW